MIFPTFSFLPWLPVDYVFMKSKLKIYSYQPYPQNLQVHAVNFFSVKTLFAQEDHYAMFVLCTNGITKQTARKNALRWLMPAEWSLPAADRPLSNEAFNRKSLARIFNRHSRYPPHTRASSQSSNHFLEKTALTFFNALILFIFLFSPLLNKTNLFRKPWIFMLSTRTWFIQNSNPKAASRNQGLANLKKGNESDVLLTKRHASM